MGGTSMDNLEGIQSAYIPRAREEPARSED
jgi:hypothetical protein